MMADFKIGDVVRLKKDRPEKIPMIIEEFVAGGAMCRSKCGLRRVWAPLVDFELAHCPDPQADLKQAICDVLLSDEFMTKFAAAFMKTPIPIQEFAFCEPSKEATNEPA